MSTAPAQRTISWRRLILVSTPLALLFGLLFLDVPLCPLRVIAGIPCPGCGLTRGTFALAHLDFPAMLAAHPFAPIIAPLLFFATARSLLIHADVLRSDQWAIFSRVPNWVWTLTVIAFLGLYALRAVGLFGGLPDPIAPQDGLIGRALRWAFGLP